MGPNRIFHLRNLILIFFVLIFVVGIGYKYMEWGFFNKLSSLQATTTTQELAINEKLNNLGLKVISNVKDLTSETATDGARLKIYGDLDGQLNLVLDNTNNYLTVIKNNAEQYKSLTPLSNLIIGKRGSLARRILSSQNGYYENEINGTNKTIVEDYLLKNIFGVSMDKTIMTIFDKKASVDPKTLYSKYFSELASLEKYTRGDFKYPDEDAIKAQNPYGFETLENNKDYMSAYYLAVTDFVAGDYESANYKYSKLKSQYLKLNVDMAKLFSENKTIKQDIQKRIVEFTVTKDSAIKEYKIGNMGKYPFLPSVGGWKEDLEMCQLYLYKGSLLSNITSKPIISKNFNEYLNELTQLSPSTTYIDDKVDKGIIKYTNSDNKLTFQCLDRQTNKKYTFTTIN